MSACASAMGARPTSIPTASTAPPNENESAPRELLERQAFEAFKAFVAVFQNLVASDGSMGAATSDVMTADEAATFLGVDRNTVYEFAARGVLPHQRLGKRVLFGRGALVAWLDGAAVRR
ncbi:MAG: helix-turn-helix domain-containing protein [Deltaproteobacteria bacterium]|nr:helix-turn-helix domain-containing protein [Deltaproteobacteria bacterium]